MKPHHIRENVLKRKWSSCSSHHSVWGCAVFLSQRLCRLSQEIYPPLAPSTGWHLIYVRDNLHLILVRRQYHRFRSDDNLHDFGFGTATFFPTTCEVSVCVRNIFLYGDKPASYTGIDDIRKYGSWKIYIILFLFFFVYKLYVSVFK